VVKFIKSDTGVVVDWSACRLFLGGYNTTRTKSTISGKWHLFNFTFELLVNPHLRTPPARPPPDPSFTPAPSSCLSHQQSSTATHPPAP
jgi:hypothetical protein